MDPRPRVAVASIEAAIVRVVCVVDRNAAWQKLAFPR